MHRRLQKLSMVLAVAGLAACSGALDSGSGGGVGGPPGAGPGANFAEGTLSSQSDIQQMADGCFSTYTMKFSGLASDSSWYILQPGQKTFPTPGLIVRTQKEPVVNDEICSDCEGKTVRVIDLGDPELKPFQEKMDFAMLMTGIQKHFLKPEILTQARYQDFTVSAVSDVAFKDLPIALNHVYFILMSNQVLSQQVTAPTAFASADEFYAMTDCSKKPEEHPFQRLRAFQARNSEPGGFPHSIPNGEDGSVQIQKLPSQDLQVITPPGPPQENPVELNPSTTIEQNNFFVRPSEP